MYEDESKVDEHSRHYVLNNGTEKLNQLKRQTPVNFLSDGNIIKGYNKDGKLVSLYDRYENYAVIEYERHPLTNDVYGERIARVYDNNEKAVVFTYNEDNMLSCITDIHGNKTQFAYDSNSLVVSYDDGRKLTFSNLSSMFNTITEEKSGYKTTISPNAYNCISLIVNYSTVDNITLDSVDKKDSIIDTVSFSYTPSSSNPITSITISEKETKEKYNFDSQGKNIAYYLEENGVVTKAEQYIYNPYWIGDEKQSDPKEVVTQALKNSLNTTPLSSYSFVAGDTVTTVLDQFNNPVTKTTNAVLISEWIDENQILQQNKQTTIVEYKYDDNQKLIEEISTAIYTNPVNSIVSHKKYNYDALGNTIRIESYIDGYEFTLGKEIEETIFDEKGNKIKSYTYNSLDSSSKFYTESDYAENGQVLADYDETGENKTEYVYDDNSKNVLAEKLPNGSKFAYGYDVDGTVTSISHSTEHGEENSTHTRYNYGEITELVSGNNKVNYEYDYKRRKTAVHLNGINNYVTYAYTDDTTLDGITVDKVVATNVKGETFTTYTDKAGKTRQIDYGTNTLLKYTYKSNGEIESVTDNLTSKNVNYVYDSLDNVTEYTCGTYSEKNEYDNYGSIKKVSHTGDITRTYEYKYKTKKDGSEDPVRVLEKITTGGYSFIPKIDVYDRNTGREVSNGTTNLMGEYIYYRKVGDHATNMPSSIYFGNIKNGKYAISDNIKYEYDNSGNITKVYENGKFVVKYSYDKLNRLVREDNKEFYITYLYAYDNMGNILSRRECEYSNKPEDELMYNSESLYTYDRDKLLSYGNELIEYDAIGNPIIYRGKTVEWTRGRFMSKYNGTSITYDGQGRRISKGGITFKYSGDSRLIKQSNGLEFIYDDSGIAGFTYNSATYLYQKDVLGNIYQC